MASAPDQQRLAPWLFGLTLLLLVGLQQSSLLTAATRMDGHLKNALHFPMFWLLTLLCLQALRALHIQSAARLAGGGMLVLAAATEGAQHFSSGTPSAWDLVIDLLAIAGALCLALAVPGRRCAVLLNGVFAAIVLSPFAYWQMQYLRLGQDPNFLISPSATLIDTFIRCGCFSAGMRWHDDEPSGLLELTYKPGQWPGFMFIDLPRDRLQRGPLALTLQGSANIKELRVSVRNRTPGLERITLPPLPVGAENAVTIDPAALGRLPASDYVDLIFEFDGTAQSDSWVRLSLPHRSPAVVARET